MFRLRYPMHVALVLGVVLELTQPEGVHQSPEELIVIGSDGNGDRLSGTIRTVRQSGDRYRSAA